MLPYVFGFLVGKNPDPQLFRCYPLGFPPTPFDAEFFSHDDFSRFGRAPFLVCYFPTPCIASSPLPGREDRAHGFVVPPPAPDQFFSPCSPCGLSFLCFLIIIPLTHRFFAVVINACCSLQRFSLFSFLLSDLISHVVLFPAGQDRPCGRQVFGCTSFFLTVRRVRYFAGLC